MWTTKKGRLAMELYIILVIASILLMGGFIVYTVIKAKEEVTSKVEEIACKVDPLVQKVSGEKYECKDEQIEFKTE